jgi:signal transduction histidine kinase
LTYENFYQPVCHRLGTHPHVIYDHTEHFSGIGLDLIRLLDIKNFYGIGFRTKSQTVGVLLVDKFRSNQAIQPEEKTLLLGIVNQILIGIESAFSYKQVEELNINLDKKVTERTRELSEATEKLQESLSQLKKLDQLKSDFVANVSHELRHPLLNIHTPLEMLLAGHYGPLPDALMEGARAMQRGALRLQKLIDDLLDYSKIEAGKMIPHLEFLDIQELIGLIVRDVKLLAAKKGITIHYQPLVNLELLHFDRDKIQKIITNLLSNALKFTQAGGSITVLVEEQPTEVRIRVRDTGIGIRQEDLNLLFERFVQVGDKNHARGTGIGLALSKELAEMHLGRLEVESQIGQGSSFTLTLNKGELKSKDWNRDDRRKNMRRKEDRSLFAQQKMETLKQDAELASSAGDSLHVQLMDYFEFRKGTLSTESSAVIRDETILIVEDNPDTADFLTVILEKEYNVLYAKNGAEGLDMVKQRLPDLVLSDVMMPVMDGEQMCAHIKNDPQIRHIPVLLLTAKAGLEEKVKGLESGADDYLNKPFRMFELSARIKSLLKIRKMHRELKEYSQRLENTLKELQETQAKLIQSEKMASLGRISAGIAHEFNNPLTSIRSNSEPLWSYLDDLKEIIASRDVPMDSEFWEDIKTMRHSIAVGIQRLSSIVKDMLNFSRLDRTDVDCVDIHNGIEESLIILGHEWQEKVEIIRDYDASRPLRCRVASFNQVMMNILANAIYAAKTRERGAKIWIRTRDIEKNISISIKDNGPGIAPEIITKIFDPFFTTKPPGHGTGLGLSLVHFFMKDHQGQVEVFSPPGQGAEFLLSFPIDRNDD